MRMYQLTGYAIAYSIITAVIATPLLIAYRFPTFWPIAFTVSGLIAFVIVKRLWETRLT